jgi:hypothetical protein
MWIIVNGVVIPAKAGTQSVPSLLTRFPRTRE